MFFTSFLLINILLISSVLPNYSGEAVRAKPPFVNIVQEIPDAYIDIRYATNNNFMGTILHGYRKGYCWVRQKTDQALKKAQIRFGKLGYSLRFFDCYRPLKAATDETPLMAASAGGLIKIVHLLLEKGAQLNEICKRGMTALHYAVNNGHYIISQMLIKKGIDKTIKIQNKYDALYIAKNKKQYALMRLLNGELDNLSFIKLKNLVETAKLIKGKLYQIKTKIIGMLPNGKLFIPVFADEDSGRKLLLMGKISPDLLSSLHPLQKIRDYLVTFEMFALAGDKVIASFTDISIPTD